MFQSIFALSLMVAAAASAQTGTQAGALGGKFVSQGLTRPLGGFAPAEPPPSSFSGYGYGYSYAYPIYVPMAQAEPRRRSAPQPPPVQHIVVDIAALLAAPAPATKAAKAAVDALPSEPPLTNYLLVAYKDHRVYTVDSYWLEGETLHYVTTEKLHNQASASLIDFAFMDRLNRR